MERIQEAEAAANGGMEENRRFLQGTMCHPEMLRFQLKLGTYHTLVSLPTLCLRSNGKIPGITNKWNAILGKCGSFKSIEKEDSFWEKNSFPQILSRHEAQFLIGIWFLLAESYCSKCVPSHLEYWDLIRCLFFFFFVIFPKWISVFMIRVEVIEAGWQSLLT